ncbi:10700_t:CDS:2 [Racocetra fulgida]|uniref:10700_t:CDS:1 n=1 Tax=Racocetra fulgida TaxID=60492 RepID=A0A9N8ZJ18_9GLOM|nr:10700_t:CDS:2 [Racocetra fulgida]
MGELLDLIGAILQNLLLTVILVAIYNGLIDISLLLQTYYYRSRKTPNTAESDNKSEESNNNSDKEFIKHNDSNVESQIPIRQSRFKQFLKVFAGFFVICFIAGLAYIISSQTKTEYDQGDELELKLLPQIF